MIRFHPPRRRLIKWAESADDWKAQAHLETCERCLRFVEERRELSDLGLSEALETVLRAPPELETELVRKAAAMRQRRATVDVLGSLAAVPLETMRILLDERRSDDAG